MNRLSVFLAATCLLCGVVFFALFFKGDVRAGFRTPLVEFTLDAKDKTQLPKPDQPHSQPVVEAKK